MKPSPGGPRPARRGRSRRPRGRCLGRHRAALGPAEGSSQDLLGPRPQIHLDPILLQKRATPPAPARPRRAGLRSRSFERGEPGGSSGGTERDPAQRAGGGVRHVRAVGRVSSGDPSNVIPGAVGERHDGRRADRGNVRRDAAGGGDRPGGRAAGRRGAQGFLQADLAGPPRRFSAWRRRPGRQARPDAAQGPDDAALLRSARRDHRAQRELGGDRLPGPGVRARPPTRRRRRSSCSESRAFPKRFRATW